MAGLLWKSLVLFNALLLALPPGWCCAAPSLTKLPAAVASSPAARTVPPCCQARARAPSESPGPVIPPARNCGCCFGNLQAVVPRPAAKAAFVALWIPLVLAPTAAAEAAPSGEIAPIPRPPGPSLQVLQCVWQC